MSSEKKKNCVKAAVALKVTAISAVRISLVFSVSDTAVKNHDPYYLLNRVVHRRGSLGSDR